MAIGQAFDKRGSAPIPRISKRRKRGAIDDVGVVAVDNDALEAVGCSAIGGWMFDRRHLTDWRILHVEIVLAHEDDGQLPDCGEVKRLVKRADIRRAIAEETNRHVLLAEILRAPSGPAGNRQMCADDRIGAKDVVLDRGQMHRAALAAH